VSEPNDPRPDPFTALRLPTTPLAPRPGFADELRAQVRSALAEAGVAPVPPTTTAPEATMSTTTAPTTSPLVPYLAVDGAAAALDWYRDVLGALETTRFVGDDGRVGHAEVVIGGARMYLADQFPEIDVMGPLERGGTTVTLHLEVVEVDHTHQRAVDAGARSERAPADQPHGSRTATVVDPWGHRWMLSEPIPAERAASAGADAPAEADAPAAGSAWTVTGRPPVEPGYLVLHTGDLARATAFFSQLFDWQIETGGAGGGHVANTRFPLGLAPPGDDDAERPTGPPTTTIYFRVDDIEPYAERLSALGGQVLERREYPSGGNALCVDDQGYRFELWTPAPGY
jgi:uncharacterized glyoxalase superfamily protein PhnB